MKILIVFLSLTKLLTGYSQVTTINNFSSNCTGYSTFKNDFHSYYEKAKPENEHIHLQTSYSFDELPIIIDSLEKTGYRLQFIYAIDGNFEQCYERINNDTLALSDSLTSAILTNINRTCPSGFYYGGFIGDKYFVLHSTKPTGLVREVFYYLIKEE
jgi:hypothetical protein